MVPVSQVIIAVLISSAVALLWLALISFYSGFLKWNKNIFRLIMGSIAAVGLAGVVEFLLFQERELFGGNFSFSSSSSFGAQIVLYIAGVAIIEELFRGVVVWWGIGKIKKTPNQVQKAATIGVVAGLFFALAENSIYFASGINASGISGIIDLVMARAIFTSAGHMVFSGIFGLLAVKAIMAESFSKKIGWAFSAIFSAFLVHFLFNFIAFFGQSGEGGLIFWVPAVIVALSAFLVIWMLKINRFQEIEDEKS